MTLVPFYANYIPCPFQPSLRLPIRVLRPSDVVPPLTQARIGPIKPFHCELKAHQLPIITHLAVAPPSCSIQLAMPWGSTT